MTAPIENLPLVLMKPTAPAVLMQYHDDISNFIAKALKKDTDYGVIPGTKKPTLYKAGAERINIAFGTHPEYVLVEKEADHDREISWKKEKKVWNNTVTPATFTFDIETGTSIGIYRYVYKCKIVKADGTSVGEGEGVCSTMESKYIDRPRDTENTVCKMSQKRAFIAATLNTFGLSDRFTQSKDDDDTGSGSANNNGSAPAQNSNNRIFLTIDYHDVKGRDDAKKLGARWDKDAKSWWVAPNNIEAIKRWGREAFPSPEIDLDDDHSDGAPPIDDSGMPPY